jgi:hypothetical protein
MGCFRKGTVRFVIKIDRHLIQIHGANFSFMCDGHSIACCRRTAPLKEREKFYDWQEVRDKVRFILASLCLKWKFSSIHLKSHPYSIRCRKCSKKKSIDVYCMENCTEESTRIRKTTNSLFSLILIFQAISKMNAGQWFKEYPKFETSFIEPD